MKQHRGSQLLGMQHASCVGLILQRHDKRASGPPSRYQQLTSFLVQVPEKRLDIESQALPT